MRRSLAAWLVGLAVLFVRPVCGAEGEFEIQALVGAPDTTAELIVGGSLDAQFQAFDSAKTKAHVGTFWVKIRAVQGLSEAGTPVLVVQKSRLLDFKLFVNRACRAVELPAATALPQFRAEHEVVFALPDGLAAGQGLYARVERRGQDSEDMGFSASTLQATLARGARHTRMIALSFGALMSMALAAFLVWFVLSDKLFMHYAGLVSLQALYVVYLSGEGFDWPLLSQALPLTSYAWNVPAALSAAVASLFVREIADLRRYLPRAYGVFGWLAAAFVLLAVANLAKFVGLDDSVAAIGNLLFLGSAVFTLWAAFNAWRRGSHPAGWFLLAWGLLEVVTIATAVSLLMADPGDAERLLYYGLPLSMVAAAILLALGVADHLREQRVALTEAERRAQTDGLTGVLNRRSLLERLDAACVRAQTRGLPIALLFIDLDHFKEINDTYGHIAGDACLKAIINPIQTELRQSDVIGRYGGEEFVVILSSADAAAAHPIAERILRRVSEVQVEGFGPPIRLTCSIGVAASDTLGVWGEHLIAHADTAVYAAKRSGRNRVQLAEPLAA